MYAAPHLSTPCCLAEPLAEYGVAGLPQVYAAQYADAVRVVEKLKRRIPKVRVPCARTGRAVADIVA